MKPYKDWKTGQKWALWISITIVLLGTFTLIERPFMFQKRHWLNGYWTKKLTSQDDVNSFNNFMASAKPDISTLYQYSVLVSKKKTIPATLQTKVDAINEMNAFIEE